MNLSDGPPTALWRSGVSFVEIIDNQPICQAPRSQMLYDESKRLGKCFCLRSSLVIPAIQVLGACRPQHHATSFCLYQPLSCQFSVVQSPLESMHLAVTR